MIVRSGRLRMVSMPGEAARLPAPLPVRFGLTVATSNVCNGASAAASIIAPAQTAPAQTTARIVRGSILQAMGIDSPVPDRLLNLDWSRTFAASFVGPGGEPS